MLKTKKEGGGLSNRLCLSKSLCVRIVTDKRPGYVYFAGFILSTPFDKHLLLLVCENTFYRSFEVLWGSLEYTHMP